MKESFPTSLELVLSHEGYFRNDPRDAGGMTNLGVTKRAWQAWVKRPVDEAEMRSLTPERVAPFYKEMYWDTCRCDELPLGIDYAVFDFSVNAGVIRASKTLQTALGTAADGVVGKNTMSLANSCDPDEFLEKFSKLKEQFYRSLQTFDVFGKGWLKRVSEVHHAAEGMIA